MDYVQAINISHNISHGNIQRMVPSQKLEKYIGGRNFKILLSLLYYIFFEGQRFWHVSMAGKMAGNSDIFQR